MASENLVDRSGVNAESLSQSVVVEWLTRNVERSNQRNIFVRQLWTPSSPKILSVRHRLQVIGIYARRLSTQMVDLVSRRDHSSRAEERLNVGKLASTNSVSVAEDPVAQPLGCELPYPARSAMPAILFSPKRGVPGAPVGMGVALAKSLGFSFDPTPSLACVGSNRGRLSTPALTQAWLGYTPRHSLITAAGFLASVDALHRSSPNHSIEYIGVKT